MRRIALIGAALIASLAMTASASARLGMVAPVAAADDGSVIQIKHGRGHGRGHHMHRGRGHHYGLYRGRGHHRHGWHRGRGHHRHWH